MKFANYFYLAIILTSVACSSSNQLTIINKEEINKRNVAMEELYDKLDASKDQRKQLRKIDRQQVRSFSDDVASVLDNKVLLAKRIKEMKAAEVKAFRSILNQEQFEVYSIYRQLQQQDLLSLKQGRSKYLVTK